MKSLIQDKNPPNINGIKPKKQFRFWKEFTNNPILFFMVLPGILFTFIFSYVPMLGLVLAFKRYNYIDGIFNSPWVGFSNFEFLFKSGTLSKITTNTILYNLTFLFVGLVLQVLTAILLSELGSKWYKKITQSVMFLPYFVSYVIISAFIYNIFNFEHGLLNGLLTQFGFEPFNAYNTPGIWKYVLLFFQQWKGLGYGVVVYLAAITGISDEYYEAAKIDGASKIQEITHITLPLLKPTIIIITLFAIGKIMKGQFDLFYQIIGDNGVLYNATDIIDTYVFRMMTKTFDPGMGTAAGLYQSVFGFLLVMTVNTIVKKISPDNALF